MTNHKWQIRKVKLANGDDAFIDAINEGQEDYRYTGRIRGSRGDLMRGIASGHSDSTTRKRLARSKLVRFQPHPFVGTCKQVPTFSLQ
jgi:hypothetical protein